MIILVDMDDTIEHLLQAWVDALNARYHRDVTIDTIRTWNVAAAYPGISRKDVYAIPDEPGFWKTVKPVEGSAEVLKHFKEEGHELYIVTATRYESIFEKMDDLLFKYFPFLDWDHVIVTSKKQMIRGDVLIDDGIHNLEGGDYVKILMNMPHNEDYDAEANGMIRVHNWQEVREVVDRLAEQTDGRK